MNKILLPSILVLGILFWGCEKENPQGMDISDPEKHNTIDELMEIEVTEFGSLSGKICYAGCSVPISGVTITISEKSEISSSDGSFTFDEIPAGTHTLFACMDDYAACQEEVTIKKRIETNLVVHLLSKRYTSKVFGKLTGENTGNIMSGLSIILLNPDGSESEVECETDIKGHFELSPVPHGNRTIVVKIDDEVLVREDLILENPEYEFDMIVPETYEFTDSRDGQVYKAVRIGNQSWMAENLAYLPTVSPSTEGSREDPYYYVYDFEGTSVFYARSTANCSEFGVLYNWIAATAVDQGNGRDICPEGWHLPSDKEWKEFEMNLGLDQSVVDRLGWRSLGMNVKGLKSTYGWIEDGNGDNSTGFNAMPGGIRVSSGKFTHLGKKAYFWASSRGVKTNAWSRDLIYSSDGIIRLCHSRGAGLSVRCVKD